MSSIVVPHHLMKKVCKIGESCNTYDQCVVVDKWLESLVIKGTIPDWLHWDVLFILEVRLDSLTREGLLR